MTGKYSASAPPGPSLQNPAPGRAHNNTSPAAVDAKTIENAQNNEQQAKDEELAKQVEPTSRDADVIASAEVEQRAEVVAEEASREVAASAEQQPANTSARRPVKAYTFFNTPTGFTQQGDQNGPNCVFCAKEIRTTDRFCSGCGRKR
jgi:hypothetical protein